MSWTSRERVIAAIEHREPDRVPININPVLDFYLDLKEYLGLEIEEEIAGQLHGRGDSASQGPGCAGRGSHRREAWLPERPPTCRFRTERLPMES